MLGDRLSSENTATEIGFGRDTYNGAWVELKWPAYYPLAHTLKLVNDWRFPGRNQKAM